MLALYVKSLDGSCRRIEVPLARTMVDIMAELEAGLPDLHEAKLVQGMSQVEDTLHVEVQSVTIPSVRKALAKLQHYTNEEHWRNDYDKHKADLNAVMETTALLATMDLTIEESESLLGMFRRLIEICDRYNYVAEESFHDSFVARRSFGESFGCACCDPWSYALRFCQLLEDEVESSLGLILNRRKVGIFLLAALAQIVRRTAIPLDLGQRLADAAERLLLQLLGYLYLNGHLPLTSVDSVSCLMHANYSCKLLGLLGNAKHEQILIRASDCRVQIENVAVALQQIRCRQATQMAEANGSPHKSLSPVVGAEDDALPALGNEVTDPVQEEQADLVRAIVNSKQDVFEETREVDINPTSSSGDARSETSFFSAATGDERCFLEGTMLRSADGTPVLVEELRQHCRILASNGVVVQILRVVPHPGPHQVVTIHDSDVYLRMTASHRVLVQRGNRHEPAPAKDLRAGDDIVCQLGVHRLAAAPMVTVEDIQAFEIVFKPNLAVETFPGVPKNAVLTMGNRPPRCRRKCKAMSDLDSMSIHAMPEMDSVSIPPTDDGFDDHE